MHLQGATLMRVCMSSTTQAEDQATETVEVPKLADISNCE